MKTFRIVGGAVLAATLAVALNGCHRGYEFDD